MSLHSNFSPQQLLEQLPMEKGAIDLSKLIQMPVGSTHHIYQIPGNDTVLLKVVIESLYEDASSRQQKLNDLTRRYAKLYETFGEENCLVESRFIQKIKDPNYPEPQEAILSFVSFNKCFQSERKFGFNTESVECNELMLKNNTTQYHAMNRALIGKDPSLPFNEEDFLQFHTSFRSIFSQLDTEPELKEAMREFLVKFKNYYDKTGELFDLTGNDNVLFYKDDDGSWKYKVGAVLKTETKDKTVDMIREIDSNPQIVQVSFENWTPIFYVPSWLRVVNATADKIGMDRVIKDITISEKDSENLSAMYKMLSIFERVFYCTDGSDLSFEDGIHHLAQFILDNKDQAFFTQDPNMTNMAFDRVLEDFSQKHETRLTDKSKEMIAVIKSLIPADTQLERDKKLATLFDLGLDVRKPFMLPDGKEFVYQPEVPTKSPETASTRKQFIVSKPLQEQAAGKPNEHKPVIDAPLQEEQRLSPKKNK